MAELIARCKNRLITGLSRIDFYHSNLQCDICVTSLTSCVAIWLIHEDFRDIFFTSQQKINIWVKVIETIGTLIFALMTITSTVETIVQKTDHLKAIRSIKKRLSPLEQDLEYSSAFPIFYAGFALLIVLQIIFDNTRLNFTRFALIVIGQFYLLHCVLQFVFVISNVERSFHLLNVELNKTLSKSFFPVYCSFIDTGNSYEPLGVHDYSNIHWAICKYVKTANNVHGLRLLAIIICILYELMFTPYLLSLNLINAHSETSRKALTYACSLIFHLAELLLLTLSADSATKEADRTRLIFSEYLSNDMSEEEFNDIAEILTYFEVHEAKFKIKNLFVLNRNFVLKIFGAVTTYTIIFVQLQDVIKFDTIR